MLKKDTIKEGKKLLQEPILSESEIEQNLSNLKLQDTSLIMRTYDRQRSKYSNSSRVKREPSRKRLLNDLKLADMKFSDNNLSPPDLKISKEQSLNQ
jgi:hypothetical protein